MNLKGIIDIDLINYKKAAMTLEYPNCNFKCDKECGMQVCQNSKLATAPTIYKMTTEIIEQYLNNPVTQAVIMQGLEPFDSLDEMHYFIQKFREVSDDDIVIYTGYTEEEIYPYLSFLKIYKNIIIKFGRFIPNQESHFDNILGVRLASPNQYAVKIS